MRSVMLFLLWGVAAATLLFPARGDASVNTEASPVPYQPSVDDEAKVNTPSSDVVLEDEVSLDQNETNLALEDKRLHGKGKKQRSKGRRIRDDSKNRKISKNRKEIEAKSKKQKRQRRKLKANRDEFRNKYKWQASKHREGKKAIRKRDDKKKGTVQVESSGESKNSTPENEESAASPEYKWARKRCRPMPSCKRGRCRRRRCRKKETPVFGGKCRGNRCVCCARSRKPEVVCRQRGKCVRQGTCRKTCERYETIAQHIPCYSSSCYCCLPSAPEPEVVCRQRGKCVGQGTCRKTCERYETIAQHIPCYFSSCYCCLPSAPVTVVCRQLGPCVGKGTCRKICRPYETIANYIPCYSFSCYCCIPSTPVTPQEPKNCRQEGVCVGQGTCRKDCLTDETPALYLPCTSSCTCCLPSSQGLCQPHNLCTRIRGTCKANCNGERVVAGLCPGPHCSCCIPAFPCSNTDSCRTSGGTCRSVCLDTEDKHSGQCGERGCFCCGPPPTQCTQTPVCPGLCSNTCEGVISLEVHCPDEDCVCCLACSPESACTHGMGVCKSLCGCGEKEIPNGCQGEGCKCCIADVLDCKENNPTCTNCVYTPRCTGLPTGQSCGHQKGCSCCAEKWSTGKQDPKL